MSKDDERTLDDAEERVVEAMLKADRIVERYRERRRGHGDDAEFDAPSITDRLILAQLLASGQALELMGGAAAGAGLTPEAVFKQIDSLRLRLFEELKAHVEHIMTSPPPGPRGPLPEGEPFVPADPRTEGSSVFASLADIPPLSPEEARSKLADLQARAARGEAAVRSTGPVRLVPKDVHEGFENVLFKGSVDMGHAKRTLELLLSTPEGNRMLTLMVHDAVIMRRRPTPGKPR